MTPAGQVESHLVIKAGCRSANGSASMNTTSSTGSKGPTFTSSTSSAAKITYRWRGSVQAHWSEYNAAVGTILASSALFGDLFDLSSGKWVGPSNGSVHGKSLTLFNASLSPCALGAVCHFGTAQHTVYVFSFWVHLISGDKYLLYTGLSTAMNVDSGVSCTSTGCVHSIMKGGLSTHEGPYVTYLSSVTIH
jgi:hypothetical protein